MRRDNEFRYSRLAHILREQIMSGFIKPGQYLLSENELCKYYGLSRTSVRKSLEQLQKEGLIVKKVGQGTIVAPDLVIPTGERRTLRILAASPSHFVDNCLGLMIEAFQNSYPHVDVKLLSFPSWNFWDSLSAGGELGPWPDLVLVTDRNFAEADGSAAFCDLSAIMAETIGDMYPRVIEPFRKSGAQLAVPATFSPVYLAYNPELFARFGVAEPRPGWTKEELLEAAGQLTVDLDGDGMIDYYGLSLSSYFSRWPVVALQNGVKFGGVGERERAELAESLAFFHDAIYRKRVATLYQNWRSRINADAFPRGKAAMVMTTTIEMAGWRSEHLPFEAKIASLPFGPVPSTLLVANAFMMPEQCPDRELAAAFLRLALDPALQKRIAAETGFLSCLPGVNEAVWDPASLALLNIAGGRIENGLFAHELFADLDKLDELDTEMDLFWAGLESAESLAGRMADILAKD
ncbi:extracellular solute-binding protein [Paenibacillus hodogayensis]|uniref:Extracellular solute-binding protein n=1 Tax=Paenibacillus hodogayensis TaxID=279208 RepID=A0ABV5VSV2_9BACL